MSSETTQQNSNPEWNYVPLLQAVYTGWVWGMGDMDSEGDQPFAVDMNGAKLEVLLLLPLMMIILLDLFV